MLCVARPRQPAVAVCFYRLLIGLVRQVRAVFGQYYCLAWVRFAASLLCARIARSRYALTP